VYTRKIFEFLTVSFGIFLLAVSIEVFLLPSKLSCGGVSTIGTIIYYTFRLPLSITNIILNIILFGFGFKIVEKTGFIKTVSGTVLFTVMLEFVKFIPRYKGDLFVAAFLGGILLGTGIGLVVRYNYSTGGSDFAGIIIKRYFPHVGVPELIFIIDVIIISVSGIVFGSITLIVYSVFALFISLKISDWLMDAGNRVKQLFIVSDEHTIISYKIMQACNRGTTGIYCKGMYYGKDKMAVLCAVSPSQVPKIIEIVRKIDNRAFIIVHDVREVFGLGFKETHLKKEKAKP